ncbi:MAG: MBL fold metallo-hydrolase [Candidatus Vogelbacteria bacterium]|nr:MBL fold metallo-hydrolase [Candidatus Vogelbacteria bacterium]
MVISYYGGGMVKVALGETVIVWNPNGRVKFGADIALVSVNDAGYNVVAGATRGDRVPFVIDGPGEYEIGGVFVKGLATEGPDGKINTVYLLILDGVRLVHLGALANDKISDKVIEEIGAVDVLFVPVGLKVISSFEPNLVIPINYDDVGLKKFLKEAGSENGQPVESFQLKKKDLADQEAAVVVLKSLSS